MLLQYVGITSGRLAETLDFYRDFGLSFQIREPNFGIMRVGSSRLRIQSVDDPAGEVFYHFAIDIPRNQIENAAKWLSKKVELLSRDGKTIIDFPDWNAKSVYFHDPSGNIVELVARRNLANDQEGEFSPAMFLRISEIGWPVVDPKSPTVKFTLPTWCEYPGFRALGKETGMVLVVEEGRPWTPTGRPAASAPIVLSVEDKKTTKYFSCR